jgi:hypothetical protein
MGTLHVILACMVVLFGEGIATWGILLTPEDRGSVANRGLILVEDLTMPDFLERRRDLTDLARIRADLLARHPELNAMRGRDLAVALRDLAHHEIPLGSAGGELDDIWVAYVAARDRKAEHSCQGINAIYRMMLTAFGFEARMIGIFADTVQQPGEVVLSHATTDVRIDGAWHAIDATFNISLRDTEGGPISWVRMYKAVQAGESFRIENDGLPPLPGRGIGDQPVRLDQYARYLVAVGDQIKFKPSTWNGTFAIRGQLRWNVGRESLPIDHRLPQLQGFADNGVGR